MVLDFSPLEKALLSLKKGLKRATEHPKDEELRDACIQRFEYSFELSWKMLKRQLEKEDGSSPEIDAYSKKNLFRVGGEKGLISNVENWFTYLEKRNLTTHTYDPENAAEVFSVIKDFLTDSEDLLDKLKARHD
jgi:nucleotidyltransferase substrate binding protein (TIGR01987 family)